MKEAAKRGGLFGTSVVGAAAAAGPDVKATRATMVSRMAVVAQAASVRPAVPSRPAAAGDLNHVGCVGQTADRQSLRRARESYGKCHSQKRPHDLLHVSKMLAGRMPPRF
jgi:hypothetical protein